MPIQHVTICPVCDIKVPFADWLQVKAKMSVSTCQRCCQWVECLACSCGRTACLNCLNRINFPEKFQSKPPELGPGLGQEETSI